MGAADVGDGPLHIDELDRWLNGHIDGWVSFKFNGQYHCVVSSKKKEGQISQTHSPNYVPVALIHSWSPETLSQFDKFVVYAPLVLLPLFFDIHSNINARYRREAMGSVLITSVIGYSPVI